MYKCLNYLTGLAIAAMLLTACEGPMGPDGKDGMDANETCKKCHNDQTDLTSKFAQVNLSKHQSGEAWFEGTRNSCAPCHSGEGFKDVVKTMPSVKSYLASASVLGNPSPIGCGTCHKIHTAYDSSDFDLRFSGSIDMLIDTSNIKSINLGNSSQLCMKCHQPRTVKTINYANAPTTNYTGINYRWGTHYGTVGAIFAGKGGFEISGTQAYTNSKHTTDASCTTCHMAAQNGMSGGHTFFVKNEENGSINKNGCTTCHTNSNTLTSIITSTQTEISGLLLQLGAKLDEIGGADGGILEKDSEGNYTGYVDIYDASANTDAKFKPSNATVNLPVFPTINNKQAAAIANFQLVIRDKSMGIHNYAYTKALLTNSIASLQ